VTDGEDEVEVVAVVEGGKGGSLFCWWGVGGDVGFMDDECEGMVVWRSIVSSVVPFIGGR
jgi:hypothetical protein